jgi:hypothetical protein
MGEKLVIGPFNRGLRTDRPAFMIDNDSFPTLINAYQWRGRVKRKRGTTLLGRLKRQVTISQLLAAGAANLGFFPIVPGSINLVGSLDGTTYTDPAMNGVLLATGGVGVGGTINYRTGAIQITAGAAETLNGTIEYYPVLPVMGLEDFDNPLAAYPNTVAFDTVYAYNIDNAAPYNIYDVSYYKNPAVNAITMPGYIPKATQTVLTWNGEDYQQFWTTNYQNAMWATNGIRIPFPADQVTSKIGMQFDIINGVAYAGSPGPVGPPVIVTFTVTASPAVVGDFVFINEIEGMTGINFQTGYVIAVGVGTIDVEFPNAVISGVRTAGGIVQYLTTRKDATLDCIRWYDGDPTLNSGIRGWVNFTPPLSQSNFSISDLPSDQYYLVSARMIVPFKDRLLFIGPVVQTSSGAPIYLPDTIIYSQNGTPYYTSSFDGSAIGALTSAATRYFPILLPDNQTSTANAYFCDTTGFGGFIQAGIGQTIESVSTNEDVLIIGFTNAQARLVYSGNDIVPFLFFLVNNELGTGSTFSTINMDQGVISRGARGYVITSQSNSQRIDLEIPDQVFQIHLQNNGAQRFTSTRDFINEWIYFSYPDNYTDYKFPNQTLLYNYRDNSWSLFNESYTHYGVFRKTEGYTWLTWPLTWLNWHESWESGNSNVLQPEVIAGNQQGFVMIREGETTQEGNSLFIENIVGSLVTSPNHTLNTGDFIQISGAAGTVGAQVNGNIFQVQVAVSATNTFTLVPSIAGGTYLGGGLIKRIYRPFIQTKQFPTAWQIARKTRLGPQQYLFTKTVRGQVQVLLYLGQDDTNAWNNSPIIPSEHVINSGLVYSTTVFTCPESTNLGLTPANTSLLQLTKLGDNNSTSNVQGQIWHRVNTSLLGDTVQIGITLSDDQMKELDDDGKFISQDSEIELMGIILDVSPSGFLA